MYVTEFRSHSPDKINSICDALVDIPLSNTIRPLRNGKFHLLTSSTKRVNPSVISVHVSPKTKPSWKKCVLTISVSSVGEKERRMWVACFILRSFWNGLPGGGKRWLLYVIESLCTTGYEWNANVDYSFNCALYEVALKWKFTQKCRLLTSVFNFGFVVCFPSSKTSVSVYTEKASPPRIFNCVLSLGDKLLVCIGYY